MNFNDLVVAILLGVFIYWGWDSGVAVNEESEDPANGPGKAAVISTLLLVVIYLIVSAGAQSFHGTGFLEQRTPEDVLSALGRPVLGGDLYKLLIISVLTSASASTQTTILPTARTTLSMAHWKAVHRVLGKVHKTYLTPDVSTISMGVLSIIVTVVLLLLSESVLADSLTAIGFPICFYYGFTGLACTIYYRRELFKSVRNFLLLGLAPLLGAAILFGVVHQGLDLLRARGQRRIGADRRDHVAIVDGHRRPDPRRHPDARLAPLLQRVLQTKNRNGAAGHPRPSARRSASGAGRLLARCRLTRRGPRQSPLAARPPARPRPAPCRPCGEPSSARRSRNGPGGNASGPSTPAPFHVPSLISSSATTGLTAVCQTTAWLPYSRIVCSLSTTW